MANIMTIIEVFELFRENESKQKSKNEHEIQESQYRETLSMLWKTEWQQKQTRGEKTEAESENWLELFTNF